MSVILKIKLFHRMVLQTGWNFLVKYSIKTTINWLKFKAIIKQLCKLVEIFWSNVFSNRPRSSHKFWHFMLWKTHRNRSKWDEESLFSFFLLLQIFSLNMFSFFDMFIAFSIKQKVSLTTFLLTPEIFLVSFLLNITS